MQTPIWNQAFPLYLSPPPKSYGIAGCYQTPRKLILSGALIVLESRELGLPVGVCFQMIMDFYWTNYLAFSMLFLVLPEHIFNSDVLSNSITVPIELRVMDSPMFSSR
jgi:hypothetical protein